MPLSSLLAQSWPISCSSKHALALTRLFHEARPKQQNEKDSPLQEPAAQHLYLRPAEASKCIIGVLSTVQF